MQGRIAVAQPRVVMLHVFSQQPAVDAVVTRPEPKQPEQVG